MSSRAYCPGCENDLSRIRSAFDAGMPCPVCGLPASAAQALEEAQTRGADQALIDRAADAEKRAAKAEREAAAYKSALRKIQDIVERDHVKNAEAWDEFARGGA